MRDTIGKEAFCLLLWQENGGRIDEGGRLVLPAGIRATGYCTCCVDCGDCGVMQRELLKHPADQQHWLCPECATVYARWSKQQGLGAVIWAHYQEGWCTNPACWAVPLYGKPKYSCFLQLALGQLPGRR